MQTLWKTTLLCLLVLSCHSSMAFPDEMTGKVCLGKNLAKSLSEHTKRLYLKIGNSEKLYFVDPYDGPTIVVKDLDVGKNHTVNVFFDEKIVQSWILDFKKLNTKSVTILRTAGAWRMDASKASACK